MHKLLHSAKHGQNEKGEFKFVSFDKIVVMMMLMTLMLNTMTLVMNDSSFSKIRNSVLICFYAVNPIISGFKLYFFPYFKNLPQSRGRMG